MYMYVTIAYSIAVKGLASGVCYELKLQMCLVLQDLEEAALVLKRIK